MQTVADAAQQTTKVIDEAKPIATSTVQTISAAEPVVILATGGALVIAYFLLPPVLSAISFNLRGYKGRLPILQLEFCYNKISPDNAEEVTVHLQKLCYVYFLMAKVYC